MNSAFDMQRSSLYFRAFRKWRLGVPLFLALLCINCGETYRPIAQPIPGPSPTPAPTGHIMAVSANGALSSNAFLNPGSMSRIDVAGDSVVGLASAGIGPVHGALTNDATRLYVVNSGEDTVSVSPISSSTQATMIDLIELCPLTSPCPVDPRFITTTESNRMYVAGSGNGTISVIDTNSNVVINTYAVQGNGSNPPLQPVPLPDKSSKPVALAELPNGTKIYSVNSGIGSVSSIDTLDGSIVKMICVAPGLTPPCPASPAPYWAVASTDNSHVYVLDDSGTISVIDTLSDTIVSQVPSAVAPGSLPNQLFYDTTFNRIYVTDASAGAPGVALFDISGSAGTLVPHVPGRAAIIPATGSACSSNPIPSSITVLGDGSRAYVASYQTGNNQVCTQADVINTGTGRVTNTVPLSQALDNSPVTNCDKARFRAFATSSLGGANSLFKVYISQCDAGTVAVIDTFSVTDGPSPHPADWLEAWVPSAVSSFPPSQIAINGATQTAGSSATSATTTFSYSILSGPAVQVGMTVYVTGMTHGGNNGAFLVASANPAGLTFTVNNAFGTTATGQGGNGSVLPPQNPVFLIASP